MDSYLFPLILFAIVGAGVITGLLFAFSNFTMSALAELPSEKGMLAMQLINRKIINPIFMLFFLGTPIACGLILVLSATVASSPLNLWLLIGAMAYLIGPFGITLTKNVPLNDQLESASLDEADSLWPAYQKNWQFWNHIRSYVGIFSIAALAVGLAAHPG